MRNIKEECDKGITLFNATHSYIQLRFSDVREELELSTK